MQKFIQFQCISYSRQTSYSLIFLITSHLLTPTYLLHLVEWPQEVGYLGKVQVKYINVAVQGDHTHQCILLVELFKEHMKYLQGDGTSVKAPQPQLVQEEVIKVALPDVKVLLHCFHCQHKSFLWGGLWKGEKKSEVDEEKVTFLKM